MLGKRVKIQVKMFWEHWPATRQMRNRDMYRSLEVQSSRWEKPCLTADRGETVEGGSWDKSEKRTRWRGQKGDLGEWQQCGR